jgi:hypothetical protein
MAEINANVNQQLPKSRVHFVAEINANVSEQLPKSIVHFIAS